MRMYDIIAKKKNGGKLTASEIDFFIRGYCDDVVPDYQVAAILMAIYFQGMDEEETANLTRSMMLSGDTIDLSHIKGIKVDKHSTGGVGDKTSIVLAPLVAAAGVPVAKMSGRGLGHTGGTLDKLDSFAGFSVEMDKDRFAEIVNTIGLAICGQTGNLVPADKKLYALRDVTATVNNTALVASSIMSKKLAAGADAIVLDVKTGSGAYMKSPEESFELALEMVKIGENMNRRTVALITNMDEPLGRAVGNALEIKEAIQTLKGEGPEDLHELCLELGARMLVLADAARDVEEGREKLEGLIASGAALNKLKEMVATQGGNPDQVDNPDLLPDALFKLEVPSPTEGYVSHIDTEAIGIAAMLLGAGREKKDDEIDLAAGVYIHAKAGDYVKPGQLLATLHTSHEGKNTAAWGKLLAAYNITPEQPLHKPLVYGEVTASGIVRYDKVKRQPV